MKPGTEVFLYLDNHTQITALEDYYQLLLSECVDRGGSLHLTSSLNNIGHTIIIDEFTNPNFCQQIESEFQIDDERLTIVATEILRNGVFNSAQTQQKSNEELMSEGVRRVQEKDHYRRQMILGSSHTRFFEGCSPCALGCLRCYRGIRQP